MASKHFWLIFSFDNKRADGAESQGRAEVSNARRILSEMRDVENPSSDRVRPQVMLSSNNSIHITNQNNSLLSHYSYDTMGHLVALFLSEPICTQNDSHQSCLEHFREKAAATLIISRKGGGEAFVMMADEYSLHFGWHLNAFCCFCHIHSFMETAFRSCHLVGLLGTDQLTKSPLGWSECRYLNLNIKHQGRSS